MTTPAVGLSADELQKAAHEHLWLHFTRMSSYADSEVPIIVRGDGCYLEDINGKRYLDALAGLFAVNIGYGFGEEIGEAAAAQLRELPFYTNWSYAHPRAIAFQRRSPRAAWYWRASFQADSTASEPPEQKKTRFRSPGVSEATSAASSIALGWA